MDASKQNSVGNMGIYLALIPVSALQPLVNCTLRQKHIKIELTRCPETESQDYNNTRLSNDVRPMLNAVTVALDSRLHSSFNTSYQ